MTRELDDIKISQTANIEAAVLKARGNLELKDKQIKEVEESCKLSYKKIKLLNKRLSNEREEAVRARNEIQGHLGTKVNKFDDIVVEIQTQIADRAKEIGILFNFSNFY